MLESARKAEVARRQTRVQLLTNLQRRLNDTSKQTTVLAEHGLGRDVTAGQASTESA
jgi:hypothetical protein